MWDLAMRTGLWDRHVANIASGYKEMYDLELFPRWKQCLWTENAAFCLILWEAEVTNVGTLKL